jgi:hypothetical protein
MKDGQGLERRGISSNDRLQVGITAKRNLEGRGRERRDEETKRDEWVVKESETGKKSWWKVRASDLLLHGARNYFSVIPNKT